MCRSRLFQSRGSRATLLRLHPSSRGEAKMSIFARSDSLAPSHARTAANDSSPAWAAKGSPCGTPICKQPAGLSRRTRRIGMKQDARKNLQRRKRQKRRLALKKYLAEKKSKGDGSVKIAD